MARLLVTGATGVIGASLLSVLPSDTVGVSRQAAASPSHIAVDITDPAFPSVLAAVKPEIIVHLAAITHIDRCEQERSLQEASTVWKTNVDASASLAAYCKQAGSHLIFLSTECVFDGELGQYREDAPVHPRNFYGLSKAAAEEAIMESGCQYTILRSVIAYHPDDEGKTVYGAIAAKLRQAEPIYAVNDMYISPTYTPDIISALTTCITHTPSGIMHVSPNQEYTPYHFARLVAQHLGYPESAINPVSAAQFFGSARAALRLPHASLANTVLSSLMGRQATTVEEALSC